MSRYIAATLLAGLAVLGGACANEPTQPDLRVAQVVVSSAGGSVQVQQSLQLHAVAKSASGDELPGKTITWSSSNETLATVSGTGLVTGVAAGSVVITAASEGREGHAEVNVAAPIVASVVVSPEQITLDWNGSRELAARAFDASGREIGGRAVQWTTGNAAVAVVSAAGLLEARGEGLTQIWGTIDGEQGVASVSVNPAPVARVVVMPSPLALESKETVQLAVRVEDPLGRPLDGRTITWASSNQTVAFVTSSGQVFALRDGDAIVTATSEGANASVPVEVAPFPTSDLIYDRPLSPDGSEIFLLGLASVGGPVQLDAGNVSRHPSPSPDGTRFVFAVSQIDFGTGQPVHDLFVVNRNGTGIRRLTDMPGMETDPAWSPDGQRIAFTASNPVTLTRDIYVINVDGTGEGLVSLTETLGNGLNEMQPAWSADGALVAFAAFPANGGQGRIWTMRADGTGHAELATDAGDDRDPTWAPGGERIAFHRLGAGANGSDIMIAPVGGGPAVRLALPGDQYEPVWSPDGQHIAFTDRSASSVIRTELYTVRPDGTGLRLRTTDPAWGGGHGPAWIRRP